MDTEREKGNGEGERGRTGGRGGGGGELCGRSFCGCSCYRSLTRAQVTAHAAGTAGPVCNEQSIAPSARRAFIHPSDLHPLFFAFRTRPSAPSIRSQPPSMKRARLAATTPETRAQSFRISHACTRSLATGTIRTLYALASSPSCSEQAMYHSLASNTLAPWAVNRIQQPSTTGGAKVTSCRAAR